MDFGVLPPEINSARIYCGPGSGPLLAAASAWDLLATELHASAAAYRSVVAELSTDGWRGPSSALMTHAITPSIAWMHGTAAQAEQTAGQARSAVTAYHAAFAAMVPPPLIAANRAQLTALVASNFFGQNSPAIAAAEARYEAMWAQDTAAMYGYAAASASAAALPPFTDPPGSTAGVAAQTAAAAAPAAAVPSLLTYLLQIPSLTSAAASISSSSFGGASIATTNHAVAVNALRDEDQGIGPFLVGLPDQPASGGATGRCAPAVSAAMGRASLVSGLSVPQSWAATVTSVVDPAASPAVGAAPATSGIMPGSGMFGEALLGTLAGRSVSNAAAKLRRPSVIPRSPAAG